MDLTSLSTVFQKVVLFRPSPIHLYMMCVSIIISLLVDISNHNIIIYLYNLYIYISYLHPYILDYFPNLRSLYQIVSAGEAWIQVVGFMRPPETGSEVTYAAVLSSLEEGAAWHWALLLVSMARDQGASRKGVLIFK